MLLHRLYGQLPVNKASANAGSGLGAKSGATGNPGDRPLGMGTAGAATAMPQPVVRLQSVRESGPGYSRQALRVNGPD
jgi:hypothetical protein